MVKSFKQFISEAIDVSDNPNFWKWFGKSVVVDAQGNPLVCYHTSVADFNKFKRSDIGIHFGSQGQAADRYQLKISRNPYGPQLAGIKHNTLAVFLRIENPLRLNDLGSWDKSQVCFALSRMPEFRNDVAFGMSITALQKVIKSKGYDGIVYLNVNESGGESVEMRKRKERALSNLVAALPYYNRKSGIRPEDMKLPEVIEYEKAFNDDREYRTKNAEDSYIVFDPKQIKSAIGNNGDFNPRDPDITH